MNSCRRLVLWAALHVWFLFLAPSQAQEQSPPTTANGAPADITSPNRPTLSASAAAAYTAPAEPLSAIDAGSIGKVIEVTLPGNVTMRFCWCPPGSFTMGSPEEEEFRDDDEERVKVTLSQGFWLAQTACTQAQWQALMGTTPSQLRKQSPRGFGRGDLDLEGPNLPMHFVSPEDARAFCTRLTAKLSLPSGWKVTLPTEAQWEYACRAGTTTTYYFGDQITDSVANIMGDISNADQLHLCAVASYPPNAWGLYDMHGNVTQLCADWYAPLLTGGTDPTGPASGTDYVSRGGHWRSIESDNRSADRQNYIDPGARVTGVGFRPILARPAPAPKAPTSLSTAHTAVVPHPLTVKIPEAAVPEGTLTSDQKKLVQKALELEKAATAAKEKGEYPESVTQYRQALRVWEEVGPLSIPPAIATRLRLSQCLVAQKQWEGAITELQLALALQDADVSEDDRITKRMPLILLQRIGKTDLLDSDLTLTNCHLLASTLAEVAKLQPNATYKATFLHEAQIFANRALFGRKNRLQPDADKLIEARQLVVALAVVLQELPFESRKTYPPREINPPDIAPLTDAARARVKSASRAALAEADQQWQQALELYDDDGFSESKPLFAAATAAYQRILGAEHPHTLRCRGVNAWLQHSLFEKEKEKVSELRTVIAAQQRVLPKDDPITLWCLDKLLYLIRNDYRSQEEALKLARDLVAAHTRISGPDHHRTLEAREDLARLLVTGTLDAQAEKEYAELTTLYTRKHGVDMEQAMQCRSALGGQLVDHGQPAAALTRLLTWLVIRDTQSIEIRDKKPVLDLAYALTLLNRPSEALVFARRAATPSKENSLYGSDHDKPFGCEALVKALETRVQRIRDGKGDSADNSIHETEGPAERPASNGANNEDSNAPDSSGKLTSADKIEKIGLTSVMMRALRGDPECQYLTFVIYKSGGPVEKNPLAAFHWALLAAEAGYLEAHNEVAIFYNKGEVVAKNYPEAIRWLRKAAAAGDANAMYNMGMSHTLGQGVEKDPGQMVYWYEKSALAGHLGAQRFLGSILQLGSEGVGQDLEAACRWFAMGAAQDDAKCLYFLGNNCYRGEGVPRDKPVAIGMWRRAAEQGNKEAQFKLGCCYSMGDEGLVKDPQSAYIWLKLAAGQGHKQAAEFASDIASHDLSKKEIADAVVQINRFKPRAPKPMPVSIAAATEKPVAPAEEGDIGIGTGFFISRSGHLVTNYHVIKDAIGIRVLLGHDEEVPATVIAQDKKADLAILKVSVPDSAKAEDRHYLPIAPAGGVKLGATVATVGFPNISVQGFSPKLSKGEISSLAGIQDDPGEFQISVPLQPGNSGGALVDAKGNVVGVVCSILDQRIALATTGTLANNVAYAVKSSLLLNLIESVPNLSDELAEPAREVRPFEDVVEDVQHATAMVLVKVKAETKTNSASKSKPKVKN